MKEHDDEVVTMVRCLGCGAYVKELPQVHAIRCPLCGGELEG